MKNSYKKLLHRIASLGEQGHLDGEIQNKTNLYKDLPNDIASAVVFVHEFFSENVDKEVKSVRSLICQLVIIIYRDAKKRDPELARAFANAFIQDFQKTPGTSLLPRWVSLAEASFAFKNLADSGNPSIIWQQATRLVLATNEFLDGLIGLIIVAWRCALGKNINTNVLGNPYGSKINELSVLTNGEDGPFYIFFRIADSKLRNGIAHSLIWLDSEKNIVRYFVGQQEKTEYEMDLIEFMAKAYMGTHMASAYVAALSVIVVLEDGSSLARKAIPAELVKLYRK